MTLIPGTTGHHSITVDALNEENALILALERAKEQQSYVDNWNLRSIEDITEDGLEDAWGL